MAPRPSDDSFKSMSSRLGVDASGQSGAMSGPIDASAKPRPGAVERSLPPPNVSIQEARVGPNRRANKAPR